MVKISTYQTIYQTIERIPRGKVATYGQISRLVGNCTARMVGYALAALPPDSDVPWHRIINRQGRISLRSGGENDELQKNLLESEGIIFDSSGKTNLSRFGWNPC